MSFTNSTRTHYHQEAAALSQTHGGAGDPPGVTRAWSFPPAETLARDYDVVLSTFDRMSSRRGAVYINTFTPRSIPHSSVLRLSLTASENHVEYTAVEASSRADTWW